MIREGGGLKNMNKINMDESTGLAYPPIPADSHGIMMVSSKNKQKPHYIRCPITSRSPITFGASLEVTMDNALSVHILQPVGHVPKD